MEREEDGIQKWSSKTNEPFCFVVVGELGAGKSTLVNNIVNEENIAETGSGARPVTNEVRIYDKEIEVPQSGGANLKLKVRAVDTPGLNDKKLPHERIFREVSEKVPNPHVLFYCVKIIDRFRLSEEQWLTAMSRCYGVDIWKRVVIVLTFADVVQSPMKDMESYKGAIAEFLTDDIKLDKSVVSNIPFCLAALHSSFKPPDYGPTGEGQIPEYNWKMELLSAAVSVVPPEIGPLILKLHEEGVLAWFKRNGLKVMEIAEKNQKEVAVVTTASAAVMAYLALRRRIG